ncbi:MAG: hypothetical protein COB46_10135 [Rhodospirillaceae bacterium]|nr:MAG: hypothetical protein COB46_10135 [Rhodospirillaceae bacterium]
MTDSNAYAPTGQIASIKKTIRHAYWHLKFLGWLLIVAMSAKFGFEYFNLYPDINQQIDRGVILAGFFILLLGSIYREISRIRKEKYANIQTELHAIHHTFRDILTCLGDIDYANANLEQLKQVKKSIERELIFSLDKISASFSMLTGTTCRACIKQIHEDCDDSRLYSYTLARDSESSKARKHIDKSRFEQKLDPIEANEDFSLLFGEDERWFFCNDLTRRATYFTSTDPTIGTGDKNNNIPWWFSFASAIGWTLPYRSTIVWPVQQREADAFHFEALGCIAFLAIDSEFKNVFHKRFDAPLGASVADGLFHPLLRFADLNLAVEELTQSAAKRLNNEE